METPQPAEEQNTEKWLNRTVIVSALFTAFIGGIVLIAWPFGAYDMSSLGSRSIPMADEGALTFLILGLALACVQKMGTNPKLKYFIISSAVFMILVAILSVIDFMTGYIWNVSNFLHQPIMFKGGFPTGIIPVSTALCFCFYGIALLLFLGKYKRVAGIFSFLNLIIGYIFFTGYIYEIPFLYTGSIIPMPLPASILIEISAIGFVFASGKENFPLRYFSGDSIRAKLMRTIVLTVFILLQILVFVELLYSEYYRTTTIFSIIIFDLISIFAFVVLVTIITRSIGNSLDKNIGELLKAQEALRKSEELYHNLIESSHDLIWQIDKEGKYTYINSTWENVTGYKLEEMLGKQFTDFQIPEERLANMAAFKQSLQGAIKIPENYESAFICKDGKIIYLITNSKFITDNYGNTIGVNGSSYDNTSRKKAEEALKKSEELYHNLVETSQDLIWQVDVEGRYTYLNPSWENVFGYKLEEMLGKKFSDFQSPEQALLDQKEFMHVVKGHVIKNYETTQICKDGKTINLVMSAKFLIDKNGNHIGASGTAYDITDRKRIEQELIISRQKMEESEERLRLSTELANVAVWEYNPIEKNMSRSKNYDQLYGIDWQEKWDYTTFQNAIHPDDRNYFNDFIQNSISPSGPSQFTFDFRVIFPDKSIHWLTSVGQVVERNSEGQGTVVRGCLINITERKTAEIQNAANKELAINRTQEIAHLGSWTLDLVSNTLTWSDETYRIFGLKPQEFRATYEAFLEAIHPDDRTMVNEVYSNSVKEDLPGYEIEHRIKNKATGEVKYVFEKAIHERNASGKIIRSIGFVQDITERKKAEEIIRQKTLELVNINTELEQFVYIASHDLQEPLRTISNFVILITEKYSEKLDKDADEYLKFIVDATSRMQNLIKDLLDFSRVERDITFSSVDCNTILKEVITELGKSIKENNAKIAFPTLPILKGNAIRLKQLFQNLISNALKFHKKDTTPEIEITVEEKDNEYLFSIKDNGIGIEEQYFKKLFVIFQRLNSATEYPGTGIGLATCNKIITIHRGKIWVESKFGQGSTFYFTIPKDLK